VAAVLDLADQLIAGGPDGHGAAAAGVAVGVGGKLADREDQVTDPARGGSGAAGVLGDERPDPGVRIPGRAA
jgi:hypothetical protein